MPNLFVATLISLAFNTAIAGLLTLVSFEPSFWLNLVFSQCIGLSIYAINATAMRYVRDWRRWPVLVMSFPGSIFLGVTLAAWITQKEIWSDPRAWTVAVIGLFFGGIGGITYFLRERIDRLDAEVKQRQLQQSETERRELEARLKLLQAQIEPHFLFNTLANVGSLIDSDPVLAKRLLERLNDWLRVALARARSKQATLDDELNLLENYLEILTVRFGDRLRWRIDAEEVARRHIFPPMLLQPLVENAVRHGIEPKLGGGEITIQAKLADDCLRVEVCDDGGGLTKAATAGAGLENVRARLAALYGNAGRFTLESSMPCGATAILEVPR